MFYAGHTSLQWIAGVKQNMAMMGFYDERPLVNLSEMHKNVVQDDQWRHALRAS